MVKHNININFLPHYIGSDLPKYASSGSSGFDICAAIKDEIVLKPLERVLVPTGFQLEIPPGYEGQVRPRSGLAAKNGITVLNTPGTIDSDYRGEVQIILINLSDKSFVITPGMRIAQMVIAPVTTVNLVKTPGLSETGRGSGGFGSSGV